MKKLINHIRYALSWCITVIALTMLAVALLIMPDFMGEC